MRRERWALLAAAVALGGACGKHATTSAAPPDVDAGADDAGDAGWPEVPRAPSKLALADIVGLSTHIARGSDPASTAERAFEWGKLAELGVHRLRTDFTWSGIEPQRGTFVWDGYDTLTSEAAAHGVDLLAVLDYGNPWATAGAGTDDHYPPDDPADFAAFAVAVEGRYAPTLGEYEIWNEPNNGLTDWKPTANGDPAKYGALLLATTNALETAKGGLSVAYAGTVYDYLVPAPDFVGASFEDTPGLPAALSTFGLHAYMIYPPIRGPESTVGAEVPLLDKLATMSGVLRTVGAPAAPLWVTEIGWPTMTDDPEDQQARYTVRAIVLGALGGADRVFLYTLLDGPNPTAFPPEDAFGLVTYSDFAADAGVPADKPVFTAVKALLGAVGGYTVTSRLTAQPDDVYVVQLAGPAGNAWVAWRALDGAAAVSVTVPASGNVLETHVDGSTVQGTAASGGYTLQVGPDPVVVTPR